MPARPSPWKRRRSLLTLLGAVLLGGCSPLSRQLSVPVSQWPGYEFFPLAHERALDRRHGLELNLPEFANPQDIVHAYLRGDLGIAQLTTVEAVDLCARLPRRCPVVVLVLDESRGGDQVVAAPGVNSIADLKGRTVAITPSSLGPFVLSRALQRQGLGLGDVNLRPMPLEAMPHALARGEVAAAALFPPFSDEAESTAGAKALFTSREIPGEIFDVLVVDPTLLASRRSELVDLLRTWQAAQAEWRARPQQSIRIMARREGVSPAEFSASLQGLVFRSLAQQLPLFAAEGTLERNLRDLRQVQVQLGLMPDQARLPPVDGTLIRDALRGDR